MKRLPFALVALSLSIPVVACLNNAADEEVASGENDLSQAAKDACNFAFTDVANPVVSDPAAAPGAPSIIKNLTSSVGITPGQKMLWGDYDGDGNKDFAVVKGAEEIQVYNGKGDGTFVKSKSAKKLPNLPNRKRTAIAIVTSGDFDGDGKSDIVAIATSKDSAAAADADAPTRGDLTILYGAKSDNSLEAPKDVPSLADPISEYTYYHVAGDLNGDGKDDLVITTMRGELVAMGGADRKLTATPTGFASTNVRSLAYITPKTADKPAALVLATPLEVATITFDATNKATVASMDYKFPTPSSGWQGTDLDQNAEKEITILSENGLDIIPVSSAQAKASSFKGVPGALIGSGDFDGNKSSELLIKVDDSKLFAACGAGERAGEIVASPIQVAYSKDVIVAGFLDLDKDGKADLVTLDISAEATRGTVKVYKSSGKQDPAPALQTFSGTGGGNPAVDAGPAVDANPGVDASAHADSSTPAVDASAGHDSGTPATDAGAKADAGPKADAGAKPDAGPKKDAGTKPDNAGDDDDDNGEEDPPGDDEGTGTKNDPPTKRPTTKPTNGATTGSSNVSIIPKPQATDDGCSAAPGSHGTSSSAFAGLFAAMMLLVRRRRNKKA